MRIPHYIRRTHQPYIAEVDPSQTTDAIIDTKKGQIEKDNIIIKEGEDFSPDENKEVIEMRAVSQPQYSLQQEPEEVESGALPDFLILNLDLPFMVLFSIKYIFACIDR